MNEPCAVCGEPTSEFCHAACGRCLQEFHLALRQDIPAKDCGQVWIDEESMALEFACNTCLDLVLPQPAPVIAPTRTRRYLRRDDTRASAIVRARRRRF
jgi:hypothetical protein